MKKQPYQKQPGDFEIRVLKDSRLVLVGPNQELIDLAQSLCQKPQDQETDEPHAKNAKSRKELKQ